MKHFQLTIDSEDEVAPAPVASTSTKKGKRKREVLEAASKAAKPTEFAAGFAFDTLGGSANDLTTFGSDEFFKRARLDTSDDSDATDDEVDENDIQGFDGLQVEQADNSDDHSSEGDSEGLEDAEFAALNGLDGSEASSASLTDEEDAAEELEDQEPDPAYFERPTTCQDEVTSFAELPNAKLSRPILLGLASMGLHTPTPVQVQTIPCVLLGKDVVGSAVTGSGKTVAFWCGVLERLLYRDKRTPATRVVAICPTRELAQQVLNVGKALARYTDITFALCVGGLSLKAQESELKQRPDVVVCTPGRLIDHVRNTPSFTLESVEILIIDEADRILEEGFADELAEIVRFCPFNRSTLLFSATITENVKDLAKLSLNKPVRVKIDALDATSATLVQEFLKVKGDQSSREATLVAACRRTFTARTLIFVRSKVSAHRLKVLFGLLGLKADELHGNLSQEQRMAALKRFREEQVDYLIATDLASRGLDIRGIENVVNFEMPKSLEIYLHRVGRTARAGKTGRSLTLVGESDRRVVKQAIKKAATVKQRKIDAEHVRRAADDIAALQAEIDLAVQQEKEEKQLRQTEMELQKGENLIKYEEDIKSRPQRSWFQSEREKKVAKARARPAADEQPPKARRPKLLNHKQRRRQEARQDDTNGRAIDASVRSFKRATKPSKMAKMRAAPSPSKDAKAKKKKSTFKTDATARPKAKPTGRKMGKAKSAISVSSKSKGGFKGKGRK